ncbi:MAG: HD domain-containing protein [Candidatus Thiodiazotropha sp.]
MLLHLVHTINDDQFKKYYQAIERSLWPMDDYFRHAKSEIEPNLPSWNSPPVARERTKLIEESMLKIVGFVAKEKNFYETFKGSGEEVSRHKLPFVERYHRYFIECQWMTPLRDPQTYYEGLFRLAHLEKDQEEREMSIEKTNYSKREGDYNHFLNVVAVLARLIDYFSDPDHICDLLVKPGSGNSADEIGAYREMADMLVYEKEADMRVLRLMFSAYYHDIGKTVVYHRHAMEGASILAGHTSIAYLQLNEIVKSYNRGWDFDRDDLMFIANMVYYHDQFGTLSTGEAGYLRLVDIVDRIKRASTHVGRDNKALQVKLSRQHLFDLWLLNLGDIIVSVKDKWIKQNVWLSDAESIKTIEGHLNSPLARLMGHDLWIAMNLLREHNRSWHSDNLADLERQALMYANRHVVERIARLVESSLLSTALKKIPETEKKYGECEVSQILRCACGLSPNFSVEKILRCELPRDTGERVILRCIQSVSNFTEFSARFAWIGQMDYALGYQDISRLRNIEFEDAGKRLTPEKIDKIIGLEGPYRARRSIESILQTIFVY